MNGRKENEKKMETKLNEYLKGCPSYMKSFYESMGNKSYLTQDRYLHYVMDFISYLENERGLSMENPEDFGNVKPSILNGYLKHIQYKEDGTEASESIRAARLYAVKAFFKFLEMDGYVNDNPCLKIDIPKIKNQNPVVALTKEQVQEIQRKIKMGVGRTRYPSLAYTWVDRNMAIVMLGIMLGLRVGSISEINIEDIDFIKRTLTVTEKGDKTRTLMLGENLTAILYTWKKDRAKKLSAAGKDTDAFFISEKCERLSVHSIETIVKHYTGVSPHKLRSTCASLLYDETGDVYLVANVLGHSNLRNTMRYTKVSEGKQKMAADIMDGLWAA